MSTSLKSFANRLQKGRVLLIAVSNFSSGFAPADGSLAPGPFGATLDAIPTLFLALGTAETAISSARVERSAVAKTVRSLTTRVLGYVKANPAWKLEFPRMKELGDRVRNVRASSRRAKVAVPAGGASPVRVQMRRGSGNGSFAEMASSFKSLVALVNGLAGFSPPDVAISAASLTALAGQFDALNGQVGTAESALDAAKQARKAAFYEDATGLAAKFAAIKQSVKGQYGQNSTEYAQVAGMRW